jgi:hypothetical protein
MLMSCIQTTIKLRGGGNCQDLHNVIFWNNLPEPSLWNSPLGRRQFLGKMGKASVGAAIAINTLKLNVLASGSNGALYTIVCTPAELIEGDSRKFGNYFYYGIMEYEETRGSAGNVEKVRLMFKTVAFKTSEPNWSTSNAVYVDITVNSAGELDATLLPTTGIGLARSVEWFNYGAAYKESIAAKVSVTLSVTSSEVIVSVNYKLTVNAFDLVWLGGLTLPTWDVKTGYPISDTHAGDDVIANPALYG